MISLRLAGCLDFFGDVHLLKVNPKKGSFCSLCHVCFTFFFGGGTGKAGGVVLGTGCR